MKLQRSLRRTVRMTGTGLHSGAPVHLTLRPANPDHGIRSDLPGSQPIPAHFNYVVNTQMATTLGSGKAKISTVEHLMAALHGVGIDNAIIEVDGPEIPIMDGSALPFFEEIQAAGTVTQTRFKRMLSLRRKVEVKVGEKWAVAEPSSRFEIHGSIDWDHPAIGFQEFHYTDGETPFYELCNSRTFGFLKDYEALKRMGLARGGSLDNAVVLDESQVINPGGLRCPQEFARHKVLDALGDLKLAGIDLCAFIRLHRAGHDLHSQLLGAIFACQDNYEIIDLSQTEEGSSLFAMPGILVAATG